MHTGTAQPLPDNQAIPGNSDLHPDVLRLQYGLQRLILRGCCQDPDDIWMKVPKIDLTSLFVSIMGYYFSKTDSKGIMSARTIRCRQI